jgi:RNA polymerase sigma-70 factor (ECF subfamily)
MPNHTAAATRSAPPATLEQRYRDGDRAALEELWRQHLPGLRGQALKQTSHDHHLVDEALAEVASRLLEERRRASYDPSQPWRPWVGAILRNYILDRFRERSNHHHVPVDDALAVEARRENIDLTIDMADCLACLTEEQRRLLQRKFVNGDRQGEIAGDLGRSDAWVSRRMQEALDALRERLQKKGYTLP